jgi:hypothetical protein
MGQEFENVNFIRRTSGSIRRVSWKHCGPRWWSLLCVVALCMTPLIVFPTLLSDKQIWTVGDLGSYNYPLHVTVLRQWRSGTVPLWNPYVTSGTPLAAAMQGGVFYPLNWFLVLLPDGFGFSFSILAHVALTGIFTFAYLRTIQLSRWASLMGALIFQLGGFAMSHLGHVALLRAIPWLPLVLLALQKWYDGRDWRWVCLGAWGMGCSILAGYPQISAYTAMTALAYLLFLLFQTDRGRWRFLGGGIALFVLGAGVAAVQLAVTAATWNEYMRVLGASFEYFSLHSFHPSYLVKLIVPMPGTEMEGYAGVPTLLLAASNLFVRHSRQRGRLLGFYAALAVVSLLLAFGSYTVLAKWTFHVPIYSSFSVLARHLLEFDFSLAVLAAFGLDVLRKAISGERPEWVSRKQGAMRGVICMGLLMGWVVAWVSAGPGIPRNRSPALVWNDRIAQGLVRAAIFSLVTLGVVWLARRVKGPHLAAAALLLLLFVDLSKTTGHIYNTSHLEPLDEIATPSDLAAFLEREKEPYRVMSFVPHGNDPFFGEPRRSKWLLPNYSVHGSIESATGYDAVFLAQLDEITNHTLPTHGLAVIQALYDSSFVRYLNLVGAKYLIVPLELALPDNLMRKYTSVFENQWARVLLNRWAFPRVFYVPQFETMTFSEVVDVMQKGTWNGLPFEPGDLALVEYPDGKQLALDPTAQGFGSTLFLLDYEIVPGAVQGEDADGDWKFVTWWACQTPVPDNYTLYVHFIDQNGQMVAQADHLLGDQTGVGWNPTQAWLCPARVKDVVSVPPQVLTALDDVRIAIGVWKPETGERLSPHAETLTIDDHGRAILGRVSDAVSTSPPTWNVSDFKRGENWVSFDLDLSHSGIVVHSSNYSAGWSARVDGQSVPVVRVDGFLQGAYVPGGHHHLEFAYRPVWFYVGMGISVLTIGLMVVVIWCQGRKKKSARS